MRCAPPNLGTSKKSTRDFLYVCAALLTLSAYLHFICVPNYTPPVFNSPGADRPQDALIPNVNSPKGLTYRGTNLIQRVKAQKSQFRQLILVNLTFIMEPLSNPNIYIECYIQKINNFYQNLNPFSLCCCCFGFWSSPPLIKVRIIMIQRVYLFCARRRWVLRFPFDAVHISLCCLAVYFACRAYISNVSFCPPAGGVILYAHTSTVCPRARIAL